MRWKLRKLLAHKPFTWLQRCCLCKKLGVQSGIHSFMTKDIEGKICRRCEINLLSEEVE